MPERSCSWCGIQFTARQFDHSRRYCSLKCAVDSQIKICDPDECWPWQGTTVKGYGVVCFRSELGKYRADARRVAYKIHVGPIPEGMILRHSCDNPICCNYRKHAIIGTHKENTQDAVQRNRMARGEKHGRHKLTSEQVSIVRGMSFCIIQKQEVAALLGISPKHLSRVLSGEKWGYS